LLPAGEYAAAVVAGVLTLRDALRLVCERGRLVQQHDGCRGVMYAVRATAADVAAALSRVDTHTLAHASMAACNGKQSCVLSGSESAVQKLISILPRGGSIRLGVSHAFHSPLMRCIEIPFRAVLNEVQFSPVKEGVTFVSTVRGRVVTSAELASVDYWVDHMLLPVQYVDAVRCAWQQGGRTYLEMGPQDTLTKLAKRSLEEINKVASTQSPAFTAFECMASLK
jgi:acyl transferase domain-containing protein